MESEKLLPCPLHGETTTTNEIIFVGKPLYSAGCSMSVKGCYRFVSRSLDEAIKCANTRAPLPRLSDPALVEELADNIRPDLHNSDSFTVAETAIAAVKRYLGVG